MRTFTVELSVATIGPVPVTVTERGEGPTAVLLLHGGGGPLTVASFADRLGAAAALRILTPIHPGFAGTPRPDTLTSIGNLAMTYAYLLDSLGIEDAVVIGNSVGGWIGAELALLAPDRVAGLVVVDGVGIHVDGHPVADFFSLTPRQLAELSYHDPDRFGIDPSKLAPDALAAMAGNRAALGVYAGESMTDAGLADRLGSLELPALVVWGAADRIADVEYGRAFAEAIPGARFEVLPETGHLPQIESPDRLLPVVAAFIGDAHASERVDSRRLQT